MGREVRLLVFWSLLLVGLVGGALWYSSNPAVKCFGMGGDWIPATGVCWCDGVQVAV